MNKMEKTGNHYQENVSHRERKNVLASQNWQGMIAIVAIATLAFTLYFNLDAKIINVQKDLNSKIDNVQKDLKQDIDKLEDKMDKRFERIEKKLDLLVSKIK